jgi:plasmid maintenance system antidote protein VapI
LNSGSVGAGPPQVKPIVPPIVLQGLNVEFKTTAESWLNMQLQYDLWRASLGRKRLRVKRLVAV